VRRQCPVSALHCIEPKALQCSVLRAILAQPLLSTTVTPGHPLAAVQSTGVTRRLRASVPVWRQHTVQPGATSAARSTDLLLFLQHMLLQDNS
jgi:hypothetical protein